MASERKQNVFLWRGILGDASPRMRIMAFAVLAIFALCQVFVSLGFVGIEVNGTRFGYVMPILLPVALAALLYGCIPGCAMGFIAGTALVVHSVLQPLDYHEALFITPASGILLIAATGLVMGVLFAVFLRGTASNGLRTLAIALTCIVAAILFSALFFAYVSNQVEMLASKYEFWLDASEKNVDTEWLVMAAFGDSVTQCLANALLMAVVCIPVDYLICRSLSIAGARSIQTTFRAWLAVVVSITFVVTEALTFVCTTIQEEHEAEQAMRSEAKYLCIQIAGHQKKVDELKQIVGDDVDDTTRYNNLVTLDGLLDGYSRDVDGTIIVLNDYTIILSDDDQFKVGQDILDLTDASSLFENDLGTMMLVAMDDGAMHRFVSDKWVEAEDGERIYVGAESAYMVLEGVDLDSDSFLDHWVLVFQPASMVFADRSGVMLWTTFLAVMLLAVVFVLASRLLKQTILRRVDETNGVLGQVTAGNLDARVEIHDSREFESLSNGINTTVETLKAWIAEAETRMDRELATAKAIQESALPRTFPPFPDNMHFDIYASMNAAREVGGDFYDFFLIGDSSDSDTGKLGFVIADVSGKGVPAALFMMRAKTQIRGYMESGMPLGEAIENANRKLCEGNDAGMFVTAWVGVLDYAMGHVEYVNAGHNPPLVWQAGEWRWLQDRSGLPLGLFEGLPYCSFEMDCKPGDEFVLYTDGVTEAMNMDEELYGESRLEEALKSKPHLHPRQMTEFVRKEVADFVNGAEQSDDITILSLEYGVPPEITATITVPASVDELPRVNAFIHTELDKRMCPAKAQNQLDIAIEELFVNVANYAYPDATPEDPGMARISYTFSATPPTIIVEIADDGIPYNPLAKPDAVTPDDIMDVPIGGLGILMAKRSVDSMRYERKDNSNILTIKKKW